MDLRCPHCHKHVFPLRSVFMLGVNGRYSSFNRPLECPYCGGYSKLSGLRQTLIDVITLAAAGLIIVFGVFITHGVGNAEIVVAGLAMGIGVAARYLAIKRFAVLVPADAAQEKEQAIHLPEESIAPNQIQEELSRLKEDKKAEFSVLFEPKGGYLSLYCRKGTFIIELAFATHALRAREKKFKEAVSGVGAIAKEFDSEGLGGYEAALGSDIGMAADKVHRILMSTFDVAGDARMPIQRD